MFYIEVFDAFNKANIRYLVVGGIAVVLYGVPRSTYDLDLVLAMDEVNLFSAIKILEKLEYKPKLPLNIVDFVNVEIRNEWSEKKNMKAFSFHKSEKEFFTIDVVFDKKIDFEKIYQQKNIKTFGEINIPIISIDDLIELKKNANRSQDISDIAALKKLLNNKK